MPRSIRIAGLSLVAWLVTVTLTWAQAPVDYRLSFADYVRHVVDVEVVFSDVTADPLEIHMSRSSPGRYALHEFAKNVFDLQISDGAGRPLTPARPNLHVWRVKDHGGTVRVRYRLFADRIDGTYVGRRRHPGAPQPAGHADVGEDARDAARQADVRAAARRRLDGGLAALRHRQSAGVHGAEPRLPARQPGAVRAADAADVPGRGERAAARAADDDPRRPAPRRHRGGSRPLRRRRREDRARGARRLRRPAGLRARALHLPRHLRARARAATAWSIATAPCSPRRPPSPRPSGRCSARWRTSSSTPGTSSASGRDRSSRSTSTTPTCRPSCGSAKASRSTTARC